MAGKIQLKTEKTCLALCLHNTLHLEYCTRKCLLSNFASKTYGSDTEIKSTENEEVYCPIHIMDFTFRY